MQLRASKQRQQRSRSQELNKHLLCLSCFSLTLFLQSNNGLFSAFQVLDVTGGSQEGERARPVTERNSRFKTAFDIANGDKAAFDMFEFEQHLQGGGRRETFNSRKS
jgi:hypothetical protein